MKCRLCGEEKKLVEAHIIAKCLLTPLFVQGGPPRIFTKKQNTFPKRIPTGEYDNEILCGGCDRVFSPWEEYTADLLMRKNNVYAAAEEAGRRGEGLFKIDSYDYAQVKLCFLSILWRMSISKRPTFKEVALGAYEERIRAMLRSADPGPWNKLPILIYRLFDEWASGSMFGPMRNTTDGLNVYQIGLPGYYALIKVDNRPMKGIFPGVALAPDVPLCISLQFSDMKKHALEMATLHAAQRRRARGAGG